MLFGVMIHKHPLLLNTLSTLIIFLFLSHHKSYNTYVIFSLFLLSLGVHGIMGVHQIYFPIINSLLLWCLQVGIISSLSLCPWNTGSFLLDSPSSFRTCKGPFLFVQVEVWRRMLNSVFSLAVFALLLRDISYHPSLWSSKTRWWSMQIQVSIQFHDSICWCYLLCIFLFRMPS